MFLSDNSKMANMATGFVLSGLVGLPRPISSEWRPATSSYSSFTKSLKLPIKESMLCGRYAARKAIAGKVVELPSRNSQLVMKVESKLVAINGTHIYYESHASRARKPVLFLHTFANDSQMWDPYLDLMASFKLYRYDMRGFGQSDLPSDGIPYSHADDLLALLDFLDLDKVRIVAPSMGGSVALEFAADHSDRVGSMLLLAPGLYGHQWNSTELWFEIENAVRTQGVNEVKSQFLKQPLLMETMKNPVAAAMLEAGMQRYTGYHFEQNDPLVLKEPSCLDKLNQITAPILVVVGAKDMPDYRMIADEIVQKCPNARKRVLPDVGHLPCLEDVETTKQIILDFLTQAKG